MVSHVRTADSAATMMVADAVTWATGPSPFVRIASIAVKVVMAMYQVDLFRTVRTSLLLAWFFAMRLMLLCPQLFSIGAVTVMLNPVSEPAMVAMVLYMASWVSDVGSLMIGIEN